MNSATLPSFWKNYRALNKDIKALAKKFYRLWAENPFHPSLHFKYINHEEDILSIRITRGYRVVGVLDADTVTWFWIGNHDEYERFF